MWLLERRGSCGIVKLLSKDLEIDVTAVYYSVLNNQPRFADTVISHVRKHRTYSDTFLTVGTTFDIYQTFCTTYGICEWPLDSMRVLCRALGTLWDPSPRFISPLCTASYTYPSFRYDIRYWPKV